MESAATFSRPRRPSVRLRSPVTRGQLLERLDAHRLLCAHRTGPRGVQEWTRRIEDWLADIDHDVTEGEWYAGRPVLVMANDYAIGLFNGDTGVAVRDAGSSLRVVFTREREMVRFRPATAGRSPDGARDDRAPQPGQPIPAGDIRAARGGLTAVDPRAAVHGADQGGGFVRLVGTEAEFRAAISRPAARASGLRLRLTQTPADGPTHAVTDR